MQCSWVVDRGSDLVPKRRDWPQTRTQPGHAQSGRHGGGGAGYGCRCYKIWWWGSSLLIASLLSENRKQGHHPRLRARRLEMCGERRKWETVTWPNRCSINICQVKECMESKWARKQCKILRQYKGSPKVSGHTFKVSVCFSPIMSFWAYHCEGTSLGTNQHAKDGGVEGYR